MLRKSEPRAINWLHYDGEGYCKFHRVKACDFYLFGAVCFVLFFLIWGVGLENLIDILKIDL